MFSDSVKLNVLINAEDKATGVLKSFKGGALEVGKAVGASLVAATAGAVAFGYASIKAFSDSQDRIAQTNAVLKSTAGIAGVTADQVTKLSTALEHQTKYSDEDVRSVENLLLTFTAIGKDIFPQATKTVLDMATALGEDTKSASIQLGKALQDPILGVTALRRVGVNFSDDQKKVIQNLVDTGQKAQAQKLILKELNTEFGGSAKAAGDTFSGAIAKLKNNFDDLQESVGATLVNAINPLLQGFNNFVLNFNIDQKMKDATTVFRLFFDTVSGGDPTLKKGEEKFAGLAKWLVVTRDRIMEVWNRVYNFLMPSFIALWHTFDQKVIPTMLRLWHEVIEPLIPVVGATLVLAVKILVDTLNALLQILMPVINWMLDHKQVVIDFAVAFGVLAAAMKFNDVKTAFLNNMNEVMGKIGAVKGSVTDLFTKIGGGAVMGGIVTAGALADIGLVMQAVQSVLGAINQMNNNAKALNNAMSSYDYAVKEIKNSKLLTPQEKSKKIQQLANDFARARGGPVSSDQAYLVGEEGPEIFVPNANGKIVPNSKINSAPGSNITFAPQIGIYAGMPSEKRKIAVDLWKEVVREARAHGVQLPQIGSVSIQ